jgi:hypothetical protein
VVARHRVPEVTARRGAAREQHDPLDARSAHLRQRLPHPVISTQQERRLDVAEMPLDRLGAVQVAHSDLGSRRHPQRVRVGADQRAHPLSFVYESAHNRAAGVPGCTSYEDHGSTVWTRRAIDIRELPEPAP